MEHEVETHAKFSMLIKHPKSQKITKTYLSGEFHELRNTGETTGNVYVKNIATPINLPSRPTWMHLEVTPTSSIATRDKDSCQCCYTLSHFGLDAPGKILLQERETVTSGYIRTVKTCFT